MNTMIVDMRAGIDEAAMAQAGEILQAGGLVAFPTETVYGLGANALDETASEKIYRAKGRPSDNPLIVHIAKLQDLYRIAAKVPKKAEALAEKFWPGPLTMIFQKKDCVPLKTTGGLYTVAVRMPDHPVALALIRAGGGYVAAPSANTSGRPSPTTAAHVAEDMTGKIEMIIDGGSVGIGVESTIVDMSGDVPMILRPGYINREMLEAVIGEVGIDPAITEADTTARPKAPGMKYRHYAPKADMLIVEGAEEKVISSINTMIEKELQEGRVPGIIATEETKDRYVGGIIKVIGSRADELSISRHLFAVLREFDEQRVSRIFSEAFDTPVMGQAIMNRLLKAAGHQVLEV